jgi:hypothetical protein
MIVTNDIADRGGQGTAVLVSHDLYAAYRGRLGDSFPGPSLVYVDNYHDLPPALTTLEPEVFERWLSREPLMNLCEPAPGY